MEVCVDALVSVVNAVKGGARRLELCSSLGVGGLTPSIGFFKICRELAPEDCKLFVMIRPRPFDFNYSNDEFRIMLEDIKAFKEVGADGFVFGCLNSVGEVNVEFCEKLIAEAHSSPCTFHRAFDEVKDPLRWLPILENLGFTRILTSGQKETALLGMDVIKKLVDECRKSRFRIRIMPGAGINDTNLEIILKTTGAQEFHGSAKVKTAETCGFVTSEYIVREMMNIGKKYNCDYKY